VRGREGTKTENARFSRNLELGKIRTKSTLGDLRKKPDNGHTVVHTRKKRGHMRLLERGDQEKKGFLEQEKKKGLGRAVRGAGSEKSAKRLRGKV